MPITQARTRPQPSDSPPRRHNVEVGVMVRREPAPNTSSERVPAQLPAHGGRRPRPPTSRTIDHTEQRADRQLDPTGEPRSGMIAPRPGIHPDLPALVALPSLCRGARNAESALGGARFACVEAGWGGKRLGIIFVAKPRPPAVRSGDAKAGWVGRRLRLGGVRSARALMWPGFSRRATPSRALRPSNPPTGTSHATEWSLCSRGRNYAEQSAFRSRAEQG